MSRNFVSSDFNYFCRDSKKYLFSLEKNSWKDFFFFIYIFKRNVQTKYFADIFSKIKNEAQKKRMYIVYMLFQIRSWITNYSGWVYRPQNILIVYCFVFAMAMLRNVFAFSLFKFKIYFPDFTRVYIFSNTKVAFGGLFSILHVTFRSFLGMGSPIMTERE